MEKNKNPKIILRSKSKSDASLTGSLLGAGTLTSAFDVFVFVLVVAVEFNFIPFVFVGLGFTLMSTFGFATDLAFSLPASSSANFIE